MKKNNSRVINNGRKEPPVALVRSWVYLLNTQAESPELRRKAASNLIAAFGTAEAVEKFCALHDIR